MPSQFIRGKPDIISKEFPGPEAEEETKKKNYDALLSATDYIAGMTDHYAVQLFQQLNGINI